MSAGALPVTRSQVMLEPDPTRVVVRPFLPGGTNDDDGRTRVEHILDRVLAMPQDDVLRTLGRVEASFGERHADLDAVLRDGLSYVAHWLPDGGAGLDRDRQRIVGAYFVHEYSIEAAALTNPSIVVAPDQSGAPTGATRFVLSLRAIGEGHISSIEFRTGLVTAAGEVEVDTPLAPVLGQRRAPVFDRASFEGKLHELGVRDGVVDGLLERLGPSFELAELEEVLEPLRLDVRASPATRNAVHSLEWLAASNYELTFPATTELSQRVLFPSGPADIRGMEDARFVRFTGADGDVRYLATYTAWDGTTILPHLVETRDFVTFRFSTLSGAAARNKGMAVFPRPIGGRIAALARSDNENNEVMLSDRLRVWHRATPVQVPVRPWELVQLGNAGAPIETPAGWLVITHAVGPLRTYALGAVLLDLDDPTRVLGHLPEPLLEPDASEREGYVPNVVYSCGSLVHDDALVIAYGASDRCATFASVPVDALLTALTGPDARRG